MELKTMFKNAHTQLALSFISVLLLTYLSCCFGCFVSLVGKLIVVSSLSWHLAKRIRKRLNNEVITSYKRAVVVTGCDTGFGNALALKLNENGYRVYATVLNPDSDGAKKLVTGSRFDGMTHVLRMDVTKDNEVQSVYEQVKNDLRQRDEELWALVNNAGVIAYGPFDWGTVDTYKKVFEVNTFGMARVTRTFVPLLRQSKGRIVNLVGSASRYTHPQGPIYAMSQHAALSFTDAIRRELRKYGIRVSTVEPMPYRTQMCANEFYQTQVDSQWADTSDEVKQLYGEDYYRGLRTSLEKSIGLKIGDNIYEVVDLLVEAVRSGDPQVRYPAVPGNCLMKYVFSVFRALPVEISDMLFYLSEKRAKKPAYLRSEE